jgi:hypothetical protein
METLTSATLMTLTQNSIARSATTPAGHLFALIRRYPSPDPIQLAIGYGEGCAFFYDRTGLAHLLCNLEPIGEWVAFITKPNLGVGYLAGRDCLGCFDCLLKFKIQVCRFHKAEISVRVMKVSNQRSLGEVAPQMPNL